MVVSRAARAVLVLIGVALLVPVLGMRLQSTDSLELFQNRVLTPWPRSASFASDPAGYFAQLNRWLADRAYPIIAATRLKNNLAYFALGASPQPNISVAPGGFVFLNGNAADSVNDLVEGACAEAEDPANLVRFQAALDALASFGRRRGLPIDVVLVPTVPTLYGDRLPRAIPSRLRQACVAGGPGRSALAALRVPDGLHFVYPLRRLGALRDDPAMFPLGNFHPDGLSVKLVRDDYLRAIGDERLPDEAVTRATGPSELLGYHGIQADFPVYRVASSGARTDETAGAAIRAASAHLFDDPVSAYVYRNPSAPDPRTVLMLSDSFGHNEAVSFSAAFRTVVRMPEPEGQVARVLDSVARLVPYDRLVLLFNDSNFARVIDTAAALAPAASGPDAG